MSTRRALIAMLHIARKDLGLDEDTYRDALAAATGKRSAKDCTDAELQDAIDAFKAKGWDGGKPKFKKSAKPHVRKVWALWGEARRAGAVTARTPHGFVKRMAKVDDPEFLTADAAIKISEALKKMTARARLARRSFETPPSAAPQDEGGGGG